MHRLMVEENTKRKDGEEALSRLPKPCDFFDLIGGTSTGGCVALYIYDHLILLTRLYEICTLQDNCFNAWASSDGCRHGNQTL